MEAVWIQRDSSDHSYRQGQESSRAHVNVYQICSGLNCMLSRRGGLKDNRVPVLIVPMTLELSALSSASFIDNKCDNNSKHAYHYRVLNPQEHDKRGQFHCLIQVICNHSSAAIYQK